MSSLHAILDRSVHIIIQGYHSDKKAVEDSFILVPWFLFSLCIDHVTAKRVR
jgi:hypothetical protein